MSDKDKIKSIDFTEQNGIKASLEMLKRNQAVLIEHHKIMAKIRRATYDAYLAEGFNEAQALELCKL